ncbi:predicted protein [Arabidopsis lyrata subsp. lyrata]|uniref:Predicted protein n=1 Tax=Arabidopsis lyrata subsp. lyrata TaxID=81972 RepID=D7KD55_ARALL|nr:predicted protein [Arabidopsis lyrata subsp. lyrata]
MEAIRVFGPKLGSKLSIRSQTSAFPPCKLSPFPLTQISSKPLHLIPLRATTIPLACDDKENNRKFEKLGPSEWGHQFLSAHVDLSEMEALGREIEALKPKVRDMFKSFKGMKSNKKNFLLIYLLVSLGLAHHFEDEIEKSIKDDSQEMEEMMAGENDLYTVSIIFWVFRTYGHNISSDVFNRFKGDNGKFKECLATDAKGILSLYEAAHMGTTTDYILDEALSFALSYLKSLAASGICKPNLSGHKNVEILVAKEYIRFYKQEEDCDNTLLKFAKLNLKFLQLHYLQELKILSKWYKEQDFESKLPPYYRDRIAELHLATLAYINPKYSRVRIFLTKIYTIQIILDDTCDRYASLRQPSKDYLKSVAKFIFNTFQEFEREVGSESGGSYSLKATIEDCKRMMRSNLQLAKWAVTGHLPGFDEYLDVAGVEIAIDFTLAGILLGMDNINKKEAYEWLIFRDKLVRAMSTKARLVNDLFGYKDDMRRGYVTNSINCYKKQYGVTEEEAFRKLHQIVAEGDKMMNEEFLKPINVPHQVLKAVLDTLRAVNICYDNEDGFTRLDGNLKNYITSMYVDI